MKKNKEHVVLKLKKQSKKEDKPKPMLDIKSSPKRKLQALGALKVYSPLEIHQLTSMVNQEQFVDPKKHDHDKERFDLIEPEFELEMARVLTHGANLYGEESWKTIDRAVRRYTAALRRHVNRMARGEIIDPATGLYHAAQISINAMFLHYFQTHKREW